GTGGRRSEGLDSVGKDGICAVPNCNAPAAFAHPTRRRRGRADPIKRGEIPPAARIQSSSNSIPDAWNVSAPKTLKSIWIIRHAGRGMETAFVKILAAALAFSQAATSPHTVKPEFDRDRDRRQVVELLQAGCSHMMAAFEIENIN